VSDRQIDLTWLGHSTVVMDVDGVRLLADPLLRDNAGILRRRGSRPDEKAWAGSDAVLVSHLHHDHAELASLRQLVDTPIFTAPDNASWLRRRGLDGRGIEPNAWTKVGREQVVGVRLTPAIHQARPMPHRPNASCGHLIAAPSGTVWVAGDTELFPGLTELPALADGTIDIAVVPVGGWGPRLSNGHMGPREAAIACRMVGARWAVPVHWGSFHVPLGRRFPRGWMDYAGPAFEASLAQEFPGCRATVLEPGESVSFRT
jgi:L-ascorbate metabolism protein UlaG (beta-lactamase superfamily)